MKNFLIIILLFLSFNSFSQSDSIFYEIIDSVTVAEVTISYDDSDREVSKKYNYLDTAELKVFIERATIKLDEELYFAELHYNRSLRNFNGAKKNLVERYGENYQNLINDSRKSSFSGEFKIILGDSIYTTRSNVANSALINSNDNTQKMRIRWIRSRVIEIKPIDGSTPFIDETIILEARSRDGELFFVGRSEGKERIVIKR